MSKTKTYKFLTLRSEKVIRGHQYSLVITQRLNVRFSFGHYKYVIFNETGDIVDTYTSTGSGHDKRITKTFIKNDIWRRFDKELQDLDEHIKQTGNKYIPWMLETSI